MKKILFGIMLIFMSVSFMFLEEFGYILIGNEDFHSILCVTISLFGLLMGIWGLFENDK